MSSLRLALKQSLQETGHLFKEKKKKSSSGKSSKSNARRRRPGDPPRKRGRPRKNPAPDDEEPLRTESREANGSEEEEQSESENEFSYDSEEEEDDSEEGEEHDEEDDNNENSHEQADQSRHPEAETEKPEAELNGPMSPTTMPETVITQKDTELDDERRRQKKIFKKHLQQAANKIQAQWKKKTGHSRVDSYSDSDEHKLPGETEERSNSPMRSRDVSSNSSTPTNGMDKKKKKDGVSKTQTVPPPEPEVLEWSRTLSEKKCRKHISSGLRVKVRFAAKVKRDGKVVKKKIWYGGRVSAVSKEGSKIRIKYDDGTSEIAKFPDKDVVVDDKFNGKHLVSADKFVPPAIVESIENEDKGDRDQKHSIDVEETEQNHEDEQDSLVSESPECGSPQISSEVMSPDVSDCSTEKLQSRNIEQTSETRQEVTSAENVLVKDHVSSLGSTPEKRLTVDEKSKRETDAKSMEDIPDGTESIEIMTPKSKSMDNMIADAIAVVAQGPRVLGTPEEGELSPGFSLNSNKSSLPEIESIDKGCMEPVEANITAGVEPSQTADVATQGIAAGTETSKIAHVEPKRAHVASPSSERAALGTETMTKNSSTIDSSPSAPKRSLTIRISNKVESGAPNTPKVDSDSDEELLADTPITERRVKSILIKGKSKRKREAESVSDDHPNKKRINLKLEKAEECKTDHDLFIPQAETSIITTKPVDTRGALEVLSALAEAQPNAVEESRKPHITISINLRKPEVGQEDLPLLPKLKKDKERSRSPVQKGRISPFSRSRSPMPAVELGNAMESEVKETKATFESDAVTPDHAPLSPKRTKVIARIKGLKEDRPEAPAIEENINDGEEARSLVRSKDSTESLPNMRTGRRAAQHAKEKMHPRPDDRGLEPGKKKKKRKRMEGDEEGEQSDESVDDRQWVQCDSCGKWRILPSNIKISSLPKHWYCHLNTYDPKRNNCNAPEQTAKQAAKEWRKARKRAKQQRLAELHAVDTEKVQEEPQMHAKKETAGAFSPKPCKVIKKEKTESKRASPIGTEDTIPSTSFSDVLKVEKKAKKIKQHQTLPPPPPPEEMPEAPSTAPTLEPEGPKKPGRKRGRPARNHTTHKENEDNENVEWVQCEKCEKWRKLPPHISADELPDIWYCSMNTWNPDSASCGAPEDKADATHHEVGTYAGIFGTGAGKYSYRSMIFGTGKKHNRPMSERSRAAESLFVRPVDEIENPYPTVMYSKSSCFLPRTSNFTKANSIEEEAPPSIFDLLSNSELWAELRTLRQPMQVSSSNVGPFHQKLLTYDSIPENGKQAMREVVLRSLGERTASGEELIMDVQRHPWENFSADLASLRVYFTADIILNSLLDLVRDGVVEMTSMKNFKVPIGQWVPKYRKVRSLRAMMIEESIKSSRCMKIAKPWKQRDCNSDWVSGGSAFS